MTTKSKGRFKADSYYKDCIVVRDENGKIIPKDITTHPGQLQIWNDWFLESIGGSYNPEDDIIDALDGERSSEHTHRIGDLELSEFDIWEEAVKSLTINERRIFDCIFMQGTSYRKAEQILGIDHCKLFGRCKQIIAKLGRGIVRRHTIKKQP